MQFVGYKVISWNKIVLRTYKGIKYKELSHQYLIL